MLCWAGPRYGFEVHPQTGPGSDASLLGRRGCTPSSQGLCLGTQNPLGTSPHNSTITPSAARGVKLCKAKTPPSSAYFPRKRALNEVLVVLWSLVSDSTEFSADYSFGSGVPCWVLVASKLEVRRTRLSVLASSISDWCQLGNLATGSSSLRTSTGRVRGAGCCCPQIKSLIFAISASTTTF